MNILRKFYFYKESKSKKFFFFFFLGGGGGGCWGRGLELYSFTKVPNRK